MIRKSSGMILAVLLALTAQAQDKINWQGFRIDSLVSVEVPYKGETQNRDKNMLWFYHGDSCFMLIQVTPTETVFNLNETRKMALDQFTGIGFDVLDEKKFTVNGKEGWDFKFAGNANSLDTLKEIRYLRVIAVEKKVYLLTFSSLISLEHLFIAKKDHFFGSLHIKLPASETSATVKTGEEKPKGNSFFVLLSAFVVVLSVAVILIVIRKKKQQQ